MASRYEQLAKLAAEVGALRAELEPKLEEMQELAEGVQEWFDSMSENWQGGKAGQKAEAVGGLDFSPESLLSELGDVLDELEGAL